ncbi:MAG: UPF0149 family protein [Gemmatimonadaceae bacterium]|nr:UPF0149 family protein [Gemmatimonadaceae bacterium]
MRLDPRAPSHHVQDRSRLRRPSGLHYASPMTAIDHAPLSEDEVQDLDTFLLNAEGVEEAMDLSTLDGFLTAIVCGPKTVLPSEWLRWVWDMERGEDTPVFRDQAQAQRIVALIVRHMNNIARTLQESPQDYEPLLLENPNDGDPIPIIDEWCTGFMKGVHLDPEGWLPVTVGQPGWMSTLMLYGTEEGWDVLKARRASLDVHKELANGLADTVRKIHAFWLDERRCRIETGEAPGVLRREPARSAPKVGRNEPCPCGSGKKYKQCHGNPTGLH